MNFGLVIRESGINPEDYPFAAAIPIVLTDRKDRVETSDVHFAAPLFAENPDGFEKFQDFLDYLDNHYISDLRVKIDINYIVILEFTPWCRNHTFFRREW